ncbi:uncharacterized protein LOC128675344 [Plodia interpunctella]|uniref:uncharacterized protein LOC128675344 n=1 Tax=Plodia interpunctella TaxID=58824 RepID=UPI002367BF1A|nr:uncharacterized protein LOC128675344 [Plodia interpunctella]
MNNPNSKDDSENDKRSPSSSDSSSSSDSDTSSKRRSRKKYKKDRRSTRLLKKLSKEVSVLRNQVFCQQSQSTPNYVAVDDNFIEANVSGELFSPARNILSPNVEPDNKAVNTQSFSICLDTSLKEPTVAKAPTEYITAVNSLQRFGDSSWSDVRYSEVQKQYSFSPGFIELEVNDEIKLFDTAKSYSFVEKSYATLTYALLKQKETLESGIRDFLKWSQESEMITYSDIKNKMEDIFLKGDFHKVSSDAMQLVCGHRADMIQQRRDSILKYVKDPLVKTALKKVPPSCSHLFEEQTFTSALEKYGGVRKTFWMKPKPNKPVAQTGSHDNYRYPAQGSSNKPAQGYYTKNRPPAQGGSYRKYLPAQDEHYEYRSTQERDYHAKLKTSQSFRGRSGRAERANDRRAPKRAASPSWKGKSRDKHKRS